MVIKLGLQSFQDLPRPQSGVRDNMFVIIIIIIISNLYSAYYKKKNIGATVKKINNKNYYKT